MANLRKEAKEFARRAKADRTYYIVVGPDIKGDITLSEIQFTKKAFIGLMWGSFSPEQFYIHHGPVYEDRNHPDIRALRTTPEHKRYEEEFEARFLGSEHHGKELENIASGTAFRSTWGPKKKR